MQMSPAVFALACIGSFVCGQLLIVAVSLFVTRHINFGPEDHSDDAPIDRDIAQANADERARRDRARRLARKLINRRNRQPPPSPAGD